MIAFIVFIIVMGLLDSLNPFSIGFQIILLPLAKKKYHMIWYIGGIFITYFIGGMIIFTGIDIVLKKLFSNINFSQMPFPLIGLLLGILLLIYVIMKISNHNSSKKNTTEFSVHPRALFLIGSIGTLFDLPTAIPYFAILAKATQMNLTILQLLPILIMYCIIYISPMLIIQLLYSLFKEKIIPLLDKIKNWFDKLSNILLIIFSILIAGFLIADGLFSLTGRSLW